MLTPCFPHRKATVEDLEPPAALSLYPTDSCATALQAAFERDYTHLTVVEERTKALLGYISIPSLRSLIDSGKVSAGDEVSRAMARFKRRATYTVITMNTPLEELEEFFAGGVTDGAWTQDFAVVTDPRRRFVMGVATVHDLEEFVKRRPAL